MLHGILRERSILSSLWATEGGNHGIIESLGLPESAASPAAYPTFSFFHTVGKGDSPGPDL